MKGYIVPYIITSFTLITTAGRRLKIDEETNILRVPKDEAKKMLVDYGNSIREYNIDPFVDVEITVKELPDYIIP